MFACSTPTVDGTDIDNSKQGASTGKRGSKRAPVTDDDDDDDSSASPRTTPTTTGTGSSSVPKTDTTAVPTTTTTTTSTGAVTPPPTTTATTPPPTTQPQCANANNPTACLNCCLDANPGAVAYEDDYQFCMDDCPQGDLTCLDDCQRQHVAVCKGNTSCVKNHACMEANNCLAQNYCNPI